MTFADKIRSMTDEELAELIHGIACSSQMKMVTDINRRLSEVGCGVSFQLVDFLPISLSDHLRALQMEVDEDGNE